MFSDRKELQWSMFLYRMEYLDKISLITKGKETNEAQFFPLFADGLYVAGSSVALTRFHLTGAQLRDRLYARMAFDRDTIFRDAELSWFRYSQLLVISQLNVLEISHRRTKYTNMVVWSPLTWPNIVNLQRCACPASLLWNEAILKRVSTISYQWVDTCLLWLSWFAKRIIQNRESIFLERKRYTFLVFVWLFVALIAIVGAFHRLY